MEPGLVDSTQNQHFRQVCAAFFNYQIDSMQNVLRIHQTFASLKPQYLQKLPVPISQRIDQMKAAVAYNFFFLLHIVHPHKDLFQHTVLPSGILQFHDLQVPYKNRSKVKSTLKQLVRDWSSQGVHQRQNCYTPILSQLQSILHPFSEGRKTSVLCPGAGLGRLPFQIASLGYRSQGNQFSYFMLLASDYIFNSVTQAQQFTLYPFIHDFTNVLQASEIFKTVRVPDICPGLILPQDSDFSMVAGEFVEVYQKQPENWDCVVTCFFMDTANNILEYIETIYRCLKPGGFWINFGPLLYHYADMPDQMSIELSWEQFRHAIQEFGF